MTPSHGLKTPELAGTRLEPILLPPEIVELALVRSVELGELVTVVRRLPEDRNLGGLLLVADGGHQESQHLEGLSELDSSLALHVVVHATLLGVGLVVGRGGALRRRRRQDLDLLLLLLLLLLGGCGSSVALPLVGRSVRVPRALRSLGRGVVRGLTLAVGRVQRRTSPGPWRRVLPGYRRRGVLDVAVAAVVLAAGVTTVVFSVVLLVGRQVVYRQLVEVVLLGRVE